MPLAFATVRASADPMRLPPAGRSSQTGPASNLPGQTVDRPLSCIAGFYGDEWMARRTAKVMRLEYGLTTAQVVLLSPRDAPSEKFARMAQLWAGQWPVRRQSVLDRRTGLALLGVVLLLLAGWPAVLWAKDQSLFNPALNLAWLGGLSGLGVVAVRTVQRPTLRPHARRFESRVQQQIADGHWALVVCKLPRAHQAGVLALLRTNSLRWCAVAEPSAKR